MLIQDGLVMSSSRIKKKLAYIEDFDYHFIR